MSVSWPIPADAAPGVAPQANKPAASVVEPVLPAPSKGQRRLAKVHATRLAAVYMVQGLDLKSYRSVLVERIGIEYRRGDTAMYHLDKGNLAKLHAKSMAAFERRLTSDRRYNLVSHRRPGTIVLRAKLKDVWLAFSNSDVVGRTRAAGEYAIQMTLDAQLIDAATGEILIVAADRRGARIHHGPGNLTGADAWREVDAAMDYWALSLRLALDKGR